MLGAGLRLIDRYHLAVAVSAGLLSVLTLYQTGDLTSRLTIFLFVTSATLVAYNIPFVPIGQGDVKSIPMEARLTGIRPVIFAVSCIAAGLLLEQLPSSVDIIILSAALITLGYIMPFRYRQTRIRGLRNVPLAKSILLAGTWTAITAGLPIACAKLQLPAMQHAGLLMERFFFILALTIAFDIRDRGKDRVRRLRTIPVVFGIDISKRIALASLFLFVAFSILQRLASEDAARVWPFAMAVVVSAVVTALVIFGRLVSSSRGLSGLMMDSTMIVQFILLWVFAF